MKTFYLVILGFVIIILVSEDFVNNFSRRSLRDKTYKTPNDTPSSFWHLDVKQPSAPNYIVHHQQKHKIQIENRHEKGITCTSISRKKPELNLIFCGGNSMSKLKDLSIDQKQPSCRLTSLPLRNRDSSR